MLPQCEYTVALAISGDSISSPPGESSGLHLWQFYSHFRVVRHGWHVDALVRLLCVVSSAVRLIRPSSYASSTLIYVYGLCW